jgi:hypothetical protein
MAKTNKYRPGPAITDPVAAIAMLLNGQWFYWQGAPKHPTVLKNMHLATIAGAARHGWLRMAIENVGAGGGS